MKKVAMFVVIGLALASTSFAQDRAVFVGGHFRDHVVVGGFVGPRVGFGFAYAPARYAPVAPAFVGPRPYYPRAVGGVVVRGGFVRGHAYVARDWHRFRR